MNTDETACDHCGQPTPRLTPPAETELCDACWQRVDGDRRIAESNEEIYMRAIRRMWQETEGMK